MDTVSSNINSITIDAIFEIQRKIDIYDLRSMVFLLYDVPHTALERLLLLQRVSRKDFNLLDDWAKQAQSRPVWKFEFLEALSICQLYCSIKKLGFGIRSVQTYFSGDNIVLGRSYVNPMKKMLYKLCENITSDNFKKLKNELYLCKIDVLEYEACELVLLHLMCTKFIILKDSKNNNSNELCQVEQLTMIIENLPGLEHFSTELREAEALINKECFTKVKQNDKESKIIKNEINICRVISEKNKKIPKLKADVLKFSKEAYPIINKTRLGVCYIINNERFYPSQSNTHLNYVDLDDRKGSLHDKTALKNTMEAFNFEVITDDNLSYKDIFKRLKHVINYNVMEQDSIFMFCVLSHGEEGCIYSADSIPLKVRDLQDLLDVQNASKLIGKPKVMIIQACQKAPELSYTLVADAPVPIKHVEQSDFLILWATVPGYSAFRDEQRGSVFIQKLCFKIKELAVEEHLEDIFKTVNDELITLCSEHGYKQVARNENTLRKKIYLLSP